jgi:hypothetical protein
MSTLSTLQTSEAAQNTYAPLNKPKFTQNGVLIGASLPAYTLDVYNNDNNPFINVYADGGQGSAAGIYLSSYFNPVSRPYPMTAIIALDRNNWSDLTFWTAPSGNNQLVERLRITTEGNVGIGTINPNAKLEVDGSVVFSKGLSVSDVSPNIGVVTCFEADYTGVAFDLPVDARSGISTTAISLNGTDLFSWILGIYEGNLPMSQITNLTETLATKAPLNNPQLTGTVIAPTPATSDNSTLVATTAYVKSNLSSYAPLSSPTFTGTPAAPTPTTADNTTKLATTAYVKSNLSSYAPLASPSFTGTPNAPTPATADNSTKLATTAYVQNNKPWVIATIDGTTGNVSTSSGNATVSCSRNSAGSYTVSYTSSPSGAPSAVLLTLRNFTGFAQYSGLSGSSMNVSTRNTSAVLADATFSIVAYL